MPHLIEIDPKATPEQIADQLEEILASGEDEWYARQGLEFAKGYPVDWYAQEYVKAVEALR